MIDYVRVVDYSFFGKREMCATRWVTFTWDSSLCDLFRRYHCITNCTSCSITFQEAQTISLFNEIFLFFFFFNLENPITHRCKNRLKITNIYEFWKLFESFNFKIWIVSKQLHLFNFLPKLYLYYPYVNFENLQKKTFLVFCSLILQEWTHIFSMPKLISFFFVFWFYKR